VGVFLHRRLCTSHDASHTHAHTHLQASGWLDTPYLVVQTVFLPEGHTWLCVEVENCTQERGAAAAAQVMHTAQARLEACSGRSFGACFHFVGRKGGGGQRMWVLVPNAAVFAALEALSSLLSHF